MPKSEILSYAELERYLESTSSLKRLMSEEMRGQIERGPQLKTAFGLIRQAEESIRGEMREVRYDLLKKSWKPTTQENEMETSEQPMRFRAPNEDEIRRQMEKARTQGERDYWQEQLNTRPWQDEGPGPLDIREG